MQEFDEGLWDVAHLNHWAVGWVSYIVYDFSAEPNSVAITDYVIETREKLGRYPLLDEELHSKMEWEENHPTEGYYAGKCLDPDCEHCELEKA